MKKYTIVKATTRDVPLMLDGKEIPLNINGSIDVEDKGVAREIEQHYGRRGDFVVASRDVVYEGHNYFFGAKNSPEWNDFWERYEKKKRRLDND